MESIRRKTAEEWGEVFSDWRRSGESQRGYCRSKEIPFSSFTYAGYRRFFVKLEYEKSGF